MARFWVEERQSLICVFIKCIRCIIFVFFFLLGLVLLVWGLEFKSRSVRSIDKCIYWYIYVYYIYIDKLDHISNVLQVYGFFFFRVGGRKSSWIPKGPGQWACPTPLRKCLSNLRTKTWLSVPFYYGTTFIPVLVISHNYLAVSFRPW